MLKRYFKKISISVLSLLTIFGMGLRYVAYANEVQPLSMELYDEG